MKKIRISIMTLALVLLTACAPGAAAQADTQLKWLTFGTGGNASVTSMSSSSLLRMTVSGLGDFATADTGAAAGCFALAFDPNRATRVPSFYCESH